MNAKSHKLKNILEWEKEFLLSELLYIRMRGKNNA